MAQQTCVRRSYNQTYMSLAISALNSRQIQSSRRATATYNIPKSMLRDRHAKKLTQRDCKPKSKKLTKLEEEVVVKHILDLNSRGFAPTLGTIRDMANKLLAKRATG